MSEPSSRVAAGLALFDRHVEALRRSAAGRDFNSDYYLGHRARFARTLELIPPGRQGSRALEIGATAFLQVALREVFGYGVVAGTEVTARIEEKMYVRSVEAGGLRADNLSISIDVENDIFPFPDASLDLVLCCEVIEHLDVDPMFMLAEINRIAAPGGHLLLTTPNSCSARNVGKILQGWRPHFHMQYLRSRSPYRHNFEYDIHALIALVEAAGFAVDHVASHDVFEAPVPDMLQFLARHGFPTEHRGDGLFLLARRVGPVKDRWPSEVYV